MKKIYFILDLTDNNDLKISSSPFVSTYNDNKLFLQMIKDTHYSGKTLENKDLHLIIVSMHLNTNSQYLLKAFDFLEQYKITGDLAFNNNINKYQEIRYRVNPDNIGQNYQNAFIKFSIDYLNEDGKKYIYYSNPEIIINKQ